LARPLLAESCGHQVRQAVPLADRESRGSGVRASEIGWGEEQRPLVGPGHQHWVMVGACVRLSDWSPGPTWSAEEWLAPASVGVELASTGRAK
jgi:hypothetical protein